MSSSRGKLLALPLMALGLGVALAAGSAGERRLREAYYLRRLATDEGDAAASAAEKLGEMRSVRAVPGLIAACIRESRASVSRRGFMVITGKIDTHLNQRARTIRRALLAVGKPAAPHLARARDEESDFASMVSGQPWRRSSGSSLFPRAPGPRPRCDRFQRAGTPP